MKISVLDHSPIRAGQPHDAPIRESIALARACEGFGYHRYWVAEHHSSESVAGSAPEVLMAAIAATTSTIRIGSAGVMLPHYSALKVAEQFRVLEAIAPGRIDLGVGRAPGSDGRTAMALNPFSNGTADNFPAQVRDLAAWSAGAPLPENHPFRAVSAEPTGPYAPQLWILGSSNYGAQMAGYFGLPYCFAYFFSDGAGAEEALDFYRRSFQPSAILQAPHSAISVWALAADTQEEAEYNYMSAAISRISRDRGRFIPIPSPDDAAAWPLSELERASLARAKARALFGTAPSVAARLRALAAELQVDELVITSTAYAPEVRVRSFELLAAEMLVEARKKELLF